MQNIGVLSWLSAIALLSCAPFLVCFFYVAAFWYDASVWLAFQGLLSGTFWNYIPTLSLYAPLILTVWVLVQVVLALIPDGLNRILPSYRGGDVKGSVTPAGNQLTYRINGLQAWVISHLLFGVAWWLGLFSPAVIFHEWGALLILLNLAGFALAFFAYMKAFASPSKPIERSFRGSSLYDFYMGVERNPRIGAIDLKLFFNGRPGIIGWTLLNLVFAAAQYERYGYVSNSMVLVNILQGAYVLYFFYKEEWYLHTIDIAHDHFGWMLAWGDLVWLPYMYTLQGLFLVFNPVELSTGYALFVLALGFAGFMLFVNSNNQKDRFKHGGQSTRIWGRTPSFIACEYCTLDGKTRTGSLLTSGWWGWARHANYTGDLMLSLAYSLACGTSSVFPYFYFIYLSILLVHRCIRDEGRCAAKYGEAWQQYCLTVPYRLIPGIF